jgi:hypothetical protein
MKLRLLVFGMALLCFTSFSCRKSVENNGLVGNWKLVEQYNGYLNGGNFQWKSVPEKDSHNLSFSTNGIYQKKEMINGAVFNCVGTYLLQADNQLEINSNCNTVIEQVFISELTPKTLILDHFGTEGVIRYKYSASK